jgi:hypothetical protein
MKLISPHLLSKRKVRHHLTFRETGGNSSSKDGDGIKNVFNNSIAWGLNPRLLINAYQIDFQ